MQIIDSSSSLSTPENMPPAMAVIQRVSPSEVPASPPVETLAMAITPPPTVQQKRMGEGIVGIAAKAKLSPDSGRIATVGESPVDDPSAWRTALKALGQSTNAASSSGLHPAGGRSATGGGSSRTIAGSPALPDGQPAVVHVYKPNSEDTPIQALTNFKPKKRVYRAQMSTTPLEESLWHSFKTSTFQNAIRGPGGNKPPNDPTARSHKRQPTPQIAPMPLPPIRYQLCPPWWVYHGLQTA